MILRTKKLRNTQVQDANKINQYVVSIFVLLVPP